MKPTESKIRDAAEDAEMSFWVTVAKQFPQITTGDLTPAAAMQFSSHCQNIVALWVEMNYEEPHTITSGDVEGRHD